MKEERERREGERDRERGRDGGGENERIEEVKYGYVYLNGFSRFVDIDFIVPYLDGGTVIRLTEQNGKCDLLTTTIIIIINIVIIKVSNLLMLSGPSVVTIRNISGRLVYDVNRKMSTS